MSALRLPYCSVNLTENRSYSVQPHHYERLRTAVDHKETGWVELELFEHPSGRALIRLEEITDLMYCPQPWIDARWEQKQAAKIEGTDE